MKDNFDIRVYRYKQMLLEAEEEAKTEQVIDDLKDEMSDILKSLETELNKASNTTNEGILTTASIAVALPAIMGLVAKFGKSAGNIVNKMLGKKPTEKDDYQEWMNKLAKIADELHHLYMVPIKGIVKKFIKDSDKANKVANGIFHMIVAAFLIASGVTAVKAFQVKNVSLATLEAALSAIKGGEIKSFISKLIA
jgi:hypothetical protein